jgi:hypothetical protein
MKRITYANVTATLALIFAMSGGALAASHYLITNIHQIKPSVVAQLRGHQGPAGSQGPQGPAGPQGIQGVMGGEAGIQKFCAALREGSTALNQIGIEEEASANPATREEGEDDRNNGFILGAEARAGC